MPSRRCRPADVLIAPTKVSDLDRLFGRMERSD